MNNKVLYIGGFALPDRNAAAQRVVGVAKTLRDLGYDVVFFNSLKTHSSNQIQTCQYFGFDCYEYRRENYFNYLFTGARVISFLRKLKPHYVVAYNYPAFALENISNYCKKHGIRCIADMTEWYKPHGNIIHRNIMKLDIHHRMHRVLYKMDGIIAISRMLFDFYNDKVPSVLIPPTVDISDPKWHCENRPSDTATTFVYAGAPSASKEQLDLIVRAVCAAASNHNVRLEVVGITGEQFCRIYDWKETLPEYIHFWGRVEHQKAVQIVSQADWAVIIREDSHLVKAGFPTKLVESISCGTPVIVNPFSNICDYLDDSNSLVTDMDALSATIEEACTRRITPKNDLFDYHSYVDTIVPLFPRISGSS